MPKQAKAKGKASLHPKIVQGIARIVIRATEIEHVSNILTFSYIPATSFLSLVLIFLPGHRLLLLVIYIILRYCKLVYNFYCKTDLLLLLIYFGFTVIIIL